MIVSAEKDVGDFILYHNKKDMRHDDQYSNFPHTKSFSLSSCLHMIHFNNDGSFYSVSFIFCFLISVFCVCCYVGPRDQIILSKRSETTRPSRLHLYYL